jgi:hypothetical protein
MSITLDTPLSVTGTFASLSEADVYLERSQKWSSSSDEDKITALIATRWFLESKYSCYISGTIPDELKYANSLLAADYVLSSSFFETTTNKKMVRVKAGPVESETDFSATIRLPPSWLNVKEILLPICGSTSSGSVYIRRA